MSDVIPVWLPLLLPLVPEVAIFSCCGDGKKRGKGGEKRGKKKEKKRKREEGGGRREGENCKQK